jgi:hypothetical protein
MYQPPPADYFLGLDLGQAKDFTACALLERRKPERRTEYDYAVRWLKRWAQGTKYTVIVAELAELVKRPPLELPVLAVDQTGVGAAVVDVLREAKTAAQLRPILITASHEVTFGNHGVRHVPKKELVSPLQVLLQSHRLTISGKLEHAKTLEKELLAFRVKITAAANETFEAWRERDHDDLVLAVALAAWLGEHELCSDALPMTFGERASVLNSNGRGGAASVDSFVRRLLP